MPDEEYERAVRELDWLWEEVDAANRAALSALMAYKAKRKTFQEKQAEFDARYK